MWAGASLQLWTLVAIIVARVCPCAAWLAICQTQWALNLLLFTLCSARIVMDKASGIKRIETDDAIEMQKPAGPVAATVERLSVAARQGMRNNGSGNASGGGSGSRQQPGPRQLAQGLARDASECGGRREAAALTVVGILRECRRFEPRAP